ncbi:MAG TPA: HAMP domain-containing sensor histidine kinase [Solirubrobacterales bacterium]|jgi:signal transduction histidine kinase|nr:HAMP domain-containing sensor histidine kinase [Solirubrobacterales bacterium]
MKRLQASLERIPVRWRIAVTTAGLTAAILVVFAVVLGNLVGDRMRNDFEDELRGAANAVASESTVAVDSVQGPVIEAPNLKDSAMADGAVIRIVDEDGRPFLTTDPGTDLGAPQASVSDTGEFSVASEPVTAGGLRAFVQYAEPDANVNDSVGRLWLFLGAGVIGGTALALLAGLAVANRAMRPIGRLTALAREIAATRDPSRRMPLPAADDEVGELARTMDGMLASLDQARGERERALERQREFVADASHELRTPLTSVQANLELLQASLDQGEDRHAVESALGSTRRMSRLVSDLLLLARADAGRRSARIEADLAEIARAVVDEVEPLASERRLSIDLSGPLPVEGNPDELHRMILNLVENALRHTPTGSTVAVGARRDDGEAVVNVSDSGPGIPEELGDQVFQRFVRGDGPADMAGTGGSGLGLAIVRAVATSHGGSVEAGTAELGGARFTVRLPLVQVQAEPVVSDADETPPARTRNPLGRRAPR